MKPWHLCADEMRTFVLETLDDNASEQWWREDVRAAYAAAAALLRDAAPWPDEALVAAEIRSGQECIIVGVPKRGWLEVMSLEGFVDDLWKTPPSLRPLTPAAAEFLAAMGGGDDEYDLEMALAALDAAKEGR